MGKCRWLAAVMMIGVAGAMVRPVLAQDAGGPPLDGAGGPPPGGPGGPDGAGGPGGPGMPGGPGGPGGQFNPEEMRQRMEQRMKDQLGVTDDEWQVIQPKLQKLQQLRFQMMVGPMGRFGPPGMPGAMSQVVNPVADATHELRQLLANRDAPADQIKVKVQALRDARAKAKQDLTAAQAELREVLSLRQEAVLASMGILD